MGSMKDIRNWYCIYTKAGKEDAVSKSLRERLDLKVFNPKIKRKKFVRGRFVEALEELFPCYIFSRFELGRYFHTIKYTRGIRRIVGDSFGNPYVVDDAIIEAIESRMVGGFVSLRPQRFAPGEKVVIQEGPLRGLEGIFLEEIKPKERVLILLNAIRCQAKVEIEPDFVGRS